MLRFWLPLESPTDSDGTEAAADPIRDGEEPTDETATAPSGASDAPSSSVREEAHHGV